MAKRAKASLSPRAKLLKAAFEQTIKTGWRGLSVAQVAQAAGLTVGEAYKVAPDRSGLMDAYVADVDASVAEALVKEPGEGSWHDQAFDALMLRFDIMLKDRDALRVIYFDERRDPIALVRAARRTHRSLERVLEAAGFAEDELGLRLGATAFLPFYARVFRIWLNDEADQAKTMAALDKALGRLERLVGRLARTGRTEPREGEEPLMEETAPRANGSTH